MSCGRRGLAFGASRVNARVRCVREQRGHCPVHQSSSPSRRHVSRDPVLLVDVDFVTIGGKMCRAQNGEARRCKARPPNLVNPLLQKRWLIHWKFMEANRGTRFTVLFLITPMSTAKCCALWHRASSNTQQWPMPAMARRKQHRKFTHRLPVTRRTQIQERESHVNVLSWRLA